MKILVAPSDERRWVKAAIIQVVSHHQALRSLHSGAKIWILPCWTCVRGSQEELSLSSWYWSSAAGYTKELAWHACAMTRAGVTNSGNKLLCCSGLSHWHTLIGSRSTDSKFAMCSTDILLILPPNEKYTKEIFDPTAKINSNPLATLHLGERIGKNNSNQTHIPYFESLSHF